MNNSVNILFVDDSEEDVELALRTLSHSGFDATYLRVETTADLEGALKEEFWDAIISDFRMVGFSGLDALAILRSTGRDLPFILVSGVIGENAAVDAMKAGASDYVMKDNLGRLGPALERELREVAIRAAHRQTKRDLVESDRRFYDVMNHVELIALMLDQDGRVSYCNDYALRITGWQRDEVLGRNWFEMFIPPKLVDVQSVFAALIADSAQSRHHENEILTWSGERRLIRWHNSSLRSSVGKMIGIASLGEDITEQRLAEEKIKRLNRVYAVLSGINALIVRVRNRQELFDGACRVAVEQGGFGIAWIGAVDQKESIITAVAGAGVEKDSDVFLSLGSVRSDIPLGQSEVGRAIRERRVIFSNDIAAEPHIGGERRKEAVRRGYPSTIALPLIAEGEVVGNLSLLAKEAGFFTDDEVALLRDLAGDISFALENIDKRHELNYLGYFDPLTGLANRALFVERLTNTLQGARRDGREVALILRDVKGFRNLNATLGRHGGDALLKELARRLGIVSEESACIAHIVADCFARILPNIRDPSDTAHYIESENTGVLKEPFSIDGKEFTIATTCGVSIFPADGEDAETLLRNAEAALRKAKRSGDSFLLYHLKMNSAVAETLLLENKLRKAMDCEQYILHYQPKIDLATGRISGLEALIRWDDPGSGLIAPALFIPVLEETGMILAVGEWAIREALSQHRQWYIQGLQPPRIAVNVSSIQLQREDFVDTVSNAIKESKALSHGLDLEITESLIMQDVKNNIGKLQTLRGMGLNIAIDDFGTGYSSLAYLMRLPVDALKIDRSFITDMTDNPDSMTIVSSMIALGHSLSKKVVGEGVETEEQWRFLKLMKCDEMQGYIFSKPLPAQELTRMLEERAASLPS